MQTMRVPLVSSIALVAGGMVLLPPALAQRPVSLGTSLVGLSFDLLAAVLMTFVGVLMATIAAYAGRNLRGQERTTRFAALLTASTVALLLLVAGSSLPVMAVGWTVSGWLLAGLVAHRGTDRSRSAARLVAGRLTIADAALWIGVALAATTWPSLARADLGDSVQAAPAATTTAIALLLVLAAAVRSALLPAWRWLPATAEAPSPVSAYLHAGVVNGGGMLLVLLWPAVSAAPLALASLIVVGAASVLAGTAAMRLRPDVKGQLAASTTAQMGYMAVQIGLGLPAVALLHLIGHGFYKSWQFLRAGGEVTRRRATLVAAPSSPRARLLGAALGALVVLVAGLLAAPAVGHLFGAFGPVVVVPLATAALAAAIPAAGAPRTSRGLSSVAAITIVASAALTGYLWVVAWWDEALAGSLAPEPTWSTGWALLWVAVLVLAGAATAAAVRRVLRRPDSGLALQILAAMAPPAPRRARRATPIAVPGEERRVDVSAARLVASTAASLVGPAFPLRSFVAASPLAGLQQWDFRVAAEMVAGTWGARCYLPEAQYRALHASGRITEEDLRAAGVTDPSQFLAAHPSDEEPGAPERSAAQVRAEAIAALWTAHVWAGPRSAAGDGLYSRWHTACREHGLGRLLGLPQADQLARSLPAEPDEALATMLSSLPPGIGAVEYAARMLTSQPGWASHAAWRAREGSPDAVIDLLALRMAVDLAVGAGQPATAMAPLPVAATTSAARLEQWQAALEAGARRRLVGRLSARAAAHAVPRPAPAAQLVFCIDVRSERLRRHLEPTGPYATYGYAGFFGAAVTYESPDGQSFAQCPVLVTPSGTVRDPRAPEPFRLAATAATSSVKAPVAPLALAEATGPVLGLTAAIQTAAPRVMGILADVVGARPVPEDALPAEAAARALPLPERVALVRAALTTLGLAAGPLAPVVVIVGHGATVQNNAFAAGYDCGACGGNPGLANARLLASALNDPDVRAALDAEGISIPGTTVAVAALHNTTTDVVTVDELRASGRAAEVLAGLRRDLARAGRAAAAERVRALPGAPSGDSDRAAAHVAVRALDWAEPAPEMGLLGNAAFVAGPRWLTDSLDLGGRVFLHSYDPAADPGRATLHQIVNAPVVVAQWINSQYYFSSVDPDHFGAGDKSTHNVVADLGVITGASGDLRIGLPWQALAAREAEIGTAGAMHEPLRLSVVLYATTGSIDAVLAESPQVAQLVGNGWITLVAIEPVTGTALELRPGRGWVPSDLESTTDPRERVGAIR